MKNMAQGTFDLTVARTSEGRAVPGAGRMTIDKVFHGDLEASSVGEMLSAGDPAKGEAGYVALERVEGTLEGKQGSFFLQHNGTMDTGNNELKVKIVPGSGTDTLAGICGTVEIAIDSTGSHSYTLEYSLPD